MPTSTPPSPLWNTCASPARSASRIPPRPAHPPHRSPPPPHRAQAVPPPAAATALRAPDAGATAADRAVHLHFADNTLLASLVGDLARHLVRMAQGRGVRRSCRGNRVAIAGNPAR